MSKDSITKPHFDTHTVSGTTVFSAAAGTMRPVRRDYFGSKIYLMGFAKIVKENQVRFVVIDFPGEYSYIVLSGCAHMMETNGLVESSGFLGRTLTLGKSIGTYKEDGEVTDLVHTLGGSIEGHGDKER